MATLLFFLRLVISFPQETCIEPLSCRDCREDPQETSIEAPKVVLIFLLASHISAEYIQSDAYNLARSQLLWKNQSDDAKVSMVKSGDYGKSLEKTIENSMP